LGCGDILRRREEEASRHELVPVEVVEQDAPAFDGQLVLVAIDVATDNWASYLETGADESFRTILGDVHEVEPDRPRELGWTDLLNQPDVDRQAPRPTAIRVLRNIGRNTGRWLFRFACGMSSHSTAAYGSPRSAPERLLTINELSDRLAISRDTVYRLVRSGALPSVRVGERLRFRPTDVDAYLERGGSGP
jgi:excisionase family DNA binding protein